MTAVSSPCMEIKQRSAQLMYVGNNQVNSLFTLKLVIG